MDELNEIIHTSLKDSGEGIKSVNVDLIEINRGMRWIKLIGAAIVMLLLPLLLDLTTTLLNWAASLHSRCHWASSGFRGLDLWVRRSVLT